MDKTEIVNKIRSLSEELRNAKAELDKINQQAKDEYEKKKFAEFIYRAGYEDLKEQVFEVYKKGTDEAGFGVNQFGLPVHGVGYYGGGASYSVARTKDEAKKRYFFDKVANYVIEVNRAAAQDKSRNKDAPYVELELNPLVEKLYTMFAEANLNGVFDDIEFEKTVLNNENT